MGWAAPARQCSPVAIARGIECVTEEVSAQEVGEQTTCGRRAAVLHQLQEENGYYPSGGTQQEDDVQVRDREALDIDGQVGEVAGDESACQGGRKPPED